MQRAAYAEKYDLGVGIEAGLFEVNEFTIDLQYCAIYDGEWLTLGCGSGFEYPPVVLDEVLAGKEVGEIMSRVAGVENLGEKQGAIGFLSKGMLTRTQLTEQSVFMALIPRMNPAYTGTDSFFIFFLCASSAVMDTNGLFFM